MTRQGRICLIRDYHLSPAVVQDPQRFDAFARVAGSLGKNHNV